MTISEIMDISIFRAKVGGFHLDIVPQPDTGPEEPRKLSFGVGMNGSLEAILQNALSSCGVFGAPNEDGEKITTPVCF